MRMWRYPSRLLRRVETLLGVEACRGIVLAAVVVLRLVLASLLTGPPVRARFPGPLSTLGATSSLRHAQSARSTNVTARPHGQRSMRAVTAGLRRRRQLRLHGDRPARGLAAERLGARPLDHAATQVEAPQLRRKHGDDGHDLRASRTAGHDARDDAEQRRGHAALEGAELVRARR